MSRRITVVFTGGTISMTHGAVDGSVVPTLSSTEICRSIPASAQFVLESVDFGQHPGPHMTLERILDLGSQVRQLIAAGTQGIVITHGTDTLEETAFLLDLLHRSDVPVVLVGAMRTSDELSWDGPVNLFAGCLVASHPGAAGRGVMVVMNNTVNAASEVTKTYTEAIDTFVSPNVGPLGVVDLQRVFFYRQPVHRTTLPEVNTHTRVELVEATAGCDGLLIHAAVGAGCRGVVVNAMGRGNVPPLMADAIVSALHQGVHVVITSRCWGGRVAPIYGYRGGGAGLTEAGALFAPWLNGAKARIALSLALALKYSHKQMQELFSGPESISAV